MPGLNQPKIEPNHQLISLYDEHFCKMIKHYQQFDLFDKLCLEKATFIPPFKIPGIMPNEACFLYVVEGNSSIHSASGSLRIQTEDCVVMNCGNYLNHWLKTKKDQPCEAIAVHFYPEVLKKIYDKELPGFIKDAAQSKPACLQKVKANELLKNYVDSLQFYFDNPSLISEELLKLKVKELILLLAKTDNADAIRQLFSSLFTPTEYTFKEIIEANIYSNLTNEDLALLTNLSLSSFKREFEKVYQSSPARYFKKRKLKRAAELLRHTNQRIGDIAFDCGFVEVSHFSKSFLKYFGVSPSEYRLNQITK